MFFLLKGKYNAAQPEKAAPDSTALAQLDSTALDSTLHDSLSSYPDSTALAADSSSQKDSLLAAIDSLKIPRLPDSVAAVHDTAALAAVPDTVIDTAIIAMFGKKPADADTAAQAEYTKKVAKLVKIIDKMKPVDTASVFSKLDDELVLQLLLRMKDRNAAKVLSQMPPSRAARLTAKLGSQTAG